MTRPPITKRRLAALEAIAHAEPVGIPRLEAIRDHSRATLEWLYYQLLITTRPTGFYLGRTPPDRDCQVFRLTDAGRVALETYTKTRIAHIEA